ncbi:hypothetical protein PIB30_097123 [Stylosanthes scabra]|uniref:RNase H type-1 domain-containing protein n=1 Tax=Stylosanthes scabra TaxID=79078 RepID=A0ABU6QXA4_9FABA|nr:hypothetical protein [Stylosanthes scabra]
MATVLRSELFAIWRGLVLAWDCSFRKIICETDCLEAYLDCIKAEIPSNNPDKDLLLTKICLKELHPRSSNDEPALTTVYGHTLTPSGNYGKEQAAERDHARTPPKLLLRQLHHYHASASAENQDSIRFYKSRGQHILLEIGPGTANLTLKLLQAAHRVHVLQHGLRHKLYVIQKDALQTQFPHFDLVLANIPTF